MNGSLSPTTAVFTSVARHILRRLFFVFFKCFNIMDYGLSQQVDGH
jgi:hypothetical protein